MAWARTEQKVRTRAGQIGVEISRSRVRTPGKAGYGLYRVRPKPRSLDKVWEIEAAWTAYAFTLEEIARAVEEAIGEGDHRGPADLRLRTGEVRTAEELRSPGEPIRVPTRWTSAYRGHRGLGEARQPEALTAHVALCTDWTEPDGFRCPGVLRFADGQAQARCDVCEGWSGRLAPGVRDVNPRSVARRMALRRMGERPGPYGVAPGLAVCGCPNRGALEGEVLAPVLHKCVWCGYESGAEVHTDCDGCREAEGDGARAARLAIERLPSGDALAQRDTPRRRQLAFNAEFQAGHLERRRYGLVRRHALKLSRINERRQGEGKSPLPPP